MITSSDNKQVKYISNLQKKSKIRHEEKAFIVEGIKMYQEIPKEYLIQTYVSFSFYQDAKNQIFLQDMQYEVLADNIFSKVSDTKTPQGILAIVKQCEYTYDNCIKEENAFVIVIENMQDPGNLGTVFRTAEAVGVTAIIMSSDTVDIYSPKVVRATMGGIFRIPFMYTDNLVETINLLKNNNIIIYGTHLSAKNEYWDEDFGSKAAIVIGNEGNGLTNEVTNTCDKLIKISMEGVVESLNAAVATSIIAYEIKRQRKGR